MAIPLTLSQVPAATPYIQYVATAGQTVFPYPFPITQDSDLVVVINGATQPVDGGYTLSGQGNALGGNVTFTSGQSNGAIITLFRDIQIERVTQIGQNSGFSSVAFNAEFNNIYLILQQLQEAQGFALQLPNTNNPAPTTTLTPGAYANKFLSFDGNGNPSPALISATVITQAILAGLLAPLTPAEQAFGLTSANINPVYVVPGDLRRYANFATGGGDVTAALTNACGQMIQAGGAPVYIPGSMGALTVTSGMPAFNVPVKIYGDGYQASQISTANDITFMTFNVGASTSLLKDFQYTAKGLGARNPAFLFTDANQVRFDGVRVANVAAGAGVRFAPGANSCYLNSFINCRIESCAIDIDAQQFTNQLRITDTTLGGGVATATITGISKAASAIVTVNTVSAVNPFQTTDVVYFSGVVGMTQINGLTGTVTGLGGSSGAWTVAVNINSSGFTSYSSGGAVGIASTGLKLTDCTDCNAKGLNSEGLTLTAIDIDNPTGGTVAGSGHTFVDPHFETFATQGDIRIGNTALVNGVTVLGGYTNPAGAVDCGVNVGAGGCNGLKVIGHTVNSGYSGGVGYVRLTGALTNETIWLGGAFAGQFSQYVSELGKVNYADRGTLSLDAPSFLDSSVKDWAQWLYYKINSGSITTNKNYYGLYVAARVEDTGAIASGSQVYAIRAEASNAHGGATKVGAIHSVGDTDLEGKVGIIGQATTGAQTATFTASNKPGSGTTAPDKWIPITLDGTVHYVPAWL